MTALTLFALFSFGCLAAAFAPETQIGKAFQRLFVDGPAQLLNAGPLKMLVVLIVLVALLMVAATMPEMIAFVGMTDLSLYLDLILVSVILRDPKGVWSVALRVVATAKQHIARLRLLPQRLGRSTLRGRRLRNLGRPKPDCDGSLSGDWAIA